MSVDTLKKALELLASDSGMVCIGMLDQANGWHMEIAARKEFAKRIAEAPESDPMEVWCAVSMEFSKRLTSTTTRRGARMRGRRSVDTRKALE
jgi:hypothetical protein